MYKEHHLLTTWQILVQVGGLYHLKKEYVTDQVEGGGVLDYSETTLLTFEIADTEPDAFSERECMVKLKFR